jgi:predicted membrane protein
VLGGTLWLLDVMDVVDIRIEVVVPALLITIGLALVLGSFEGAHPGLVVAGVVVAIATLVTAVTPTGAFEGGLGEREVRVTQQADLDDRYDVGIGALRLDLSDLTLTRSADVSASVGTGELVVMLPPDVPVSVEAGAGAGDLEVVGQSADGMSETLSYTSSDYADATVRLTLDLDVAAGRIEVTR